MGSLKIQSRTSCYVILCRIFGWSYSTQMTILGNIECEICNAADFDIEEVGFEWEFGGQCSEHYIWVCKECNNWDTIKEFMNDL